MHTFSLVRPRRRPLVPLVMAGCLTIGPSVLLFAGAAAPGESLRQAHRILRALDRFLDHHPLLENDLRLDPQLVGDAGYCAKNPALADFVAGNPGVIPALQMEPRHFLHRALIREAGAPLRHAEVAQLDSFFAAEPAIERQIIDDPARIRDPDYLRLHAPLSDFLAQHPLLNSVFRPDPPGADNVLSPTPARPRAPPPDAPNTIRIPKPPDLRPLRN